jgi:MFS transporter, SP family, general alpha glucoside:H+ symporter
MSSSPLQQTQLIRDQAIQWVWPVVLLIGLPFAPESPYWLIRKNRKDDARKALEKLSSSKHRPDIESVLIMIEQTDLLEQELESTTTYMDCFKGANWPRTEISIMVYLIQVIGGNPLIGYANFFFEQAGLNSADAFNSQSIQFSHRININSTQWAWATPLSAS